MPRLYDAICACLEAWAEATRTDTLEAEMDNLDMSDWND